MSINHRELSLLLSEANELSQKATWTKADERRNTFLLSAIAAVKSGASLQEIQLGELNAIEERGGLPKTSFQRPSEKRAAALEWQKLFSNAISQPEKRVDLLNGEQRDSGVGHGRPEYFQGSQGSFVPRTYLPGIIAALRLYDPIFSPDVVSYVETEGGNPLQVGFMSSTESAAQSVSAENSDQSANEVDPAQVSEVDVVAWSYRTPMWRLSLEALQDLDGLTTAMEIFQRFAADRIARGVGRDLITGNGSGKPLGLLTSLVALGPAAEGGVAVGDSETTGGAQTGANSIGHSDLVTLYHSIDPAYRMQPKCAWLMSDSTKLFLDGILDKYGRPIFVPLADGRNLLFGKPVHVSPSMPAIGSSATPIIFGDLSYWITRHATAGDKIQLLKEFVGGVERGECGLRTWSRFDGALAYSDGNGTCPIKYLLCHS